MSEFSEGTMQDQAPQSSEGYRGRRFIIDLQPNRPGANRTASCRGCRVAFEAGEMRACPFAKKKARGGWYVHLDCVHGGWQAEGRAQTEDTIVQSHGHSLTTRGVQLISAAAASETPDPEMPDAPVMGDAVMQVAGPAGSSAPLTGQDNGAKNCFE